MATNNPQVLLFTNYLEDFEWKQIKDYAEKMEHDFDYLGSGDSPIRFKKVKHSRLNHIEYERCFILEDEEYQLIRTKQKPEPYPESMGNETDWQTLMHRPIDENIKNLLSKVLDKSQEIIFEIFGDKTVWEFGPYLSMYGEGKSLRLHCDGFQYGMDGYPQTDYSTVYYINDDYSGGEYTIPAMGITYKPVANSMLLVSNSPHEDAAHSVGKVLSGNRFMSAGFFTIDKGNQ